MKIKLPTLLALLFVPIWLIAQQTDPVHWSYTVKPVSGDNYELHLTATMDAGWHIYAQYQPTEAIAVPTRISFTKNALLLMTGQLAEIGKKEKYEDKAAGIIQYQYKAVEFTQTITLKSPVKTRVSGTVTYQACSEEKCLPPKTIPFTVDIL